MQNKLLIEFSRIYNSFRRYMAFILWLLPDSILRFKIKSFWILVTGFLGVTFQIQAIGLILLYARKFSSGDSISIIGVTYFPRTSIFFLIIWTTFVLFSLILSSLMIYFSRTSALKLARRYAEFCAQRVFFLLSDEIQYYAVAEVSTQNDKGLAKLVISDSRICSRVLRILLYLITPIVTFVVALGALVHLSLSVTLLMAFSFPILLFFQYRINRLAASQTIIFEKASIDASKHIHQTIKYLKLRNFIVNEGNREAIFSTFRSQSVRRQFDSFFARLKTVESSKLASNAFMASSLCILLLVFGSSIIQEGRGWERLLIYVIALRYAVTNMQMVFSQLTVLNRFYPQLRRYFLFVNSFMKIVRLPGDKVDQYALKTSKVILPNSESCKILTPGSITSLITALEINRYTLSIIGRSLFDVSNNECSNPIFSMRFVSVESNLSGMSLRQIFSMDEKSDWSDIRPWITDDQMWELFNSHAKKDLDSYIQEKEWNLMDTRIKLVINLIESYRSDCQWILIEESISEIIGKENLNFYINLLQQKFIIIVFNRQFHRVGNYGENTVAVLHNEQLIGIGSLEWFTFVNNLVNKLIRDEQISIGKGIKFENDEEIDDDF